MANTESDFDLSQLSPSQLESLQQYTDFTSQDVKDAVPLLERSQWNVQVQIPIYPIGGVPPDDRANLEHCRLQ